jgi:hypothetical protein
MGSYNSRGRRRGIRSRRFHAHPWRSDQRVDVETETKSRYCSRRGTRMCSREGSRRQSPGIFKLPWPVPADTA